MIAEREVGLLEALSRIRIMRMTGLAIRLVCNEIHKPLSDKRWSL
jgi:hypothetical protein